MFDNIGRTIYFIGVILFVIFLLAGLIFFIVDGGWFEIFFLLACGSIISAFVVAIPLCGFGTLIMNSDEIKQSLKQLEYKGKNKLSSEKKEANKEIYNELPEL